MESYDNTSMNQTLLDEMALETAAKEHFGFNVEVGKIIARDIDVARTARATVYLSKKKQLLCYIHADSKLSLGEVRKIVTRMGLRAEMYMPPRGRPQYFEEVATEQYRSVFPGRKPTADDDLAYYRTLAMYNPALILIAEVRDGHIYQFDPDARTHWRVATKFAYRRIKTS